MKQLFTGIYNLFAPAGAKPTIYTNLDGKLRLFEAKQGETLPYCVYYLIGDGPDWYFEDERIFRAMIQFNLYTDDRSATNVCTYTDNLMALYDECTLSVTGYTFLRMERTWEYLLRDPEEQVWQYVVQYRVTLEKLT